MDITTIVLIFKKEFAMLRSIHYRVGLLTCMLFTSGILVAGSLGGNAAAQPGEQPVGNELILEPPPDSTGEISSDTLPPIEKMPEVLVPRPIGTDRLSHLSFLSSRFIALGGQSSKQIWL